MSELTFSAVILGVYHHEFSASNFLTSFLLVSLLISINRLNISGNCWRLFISVKNSCPLIVTRAPTKQTARQNMLRTCQTQFYQINLENLIFSFGFYFLMLVDVRFSMDAMKGGDESSQMIIRISLKWLHSKCLFLKLPVDNIPSTESSASFSSFCI